MLGIDLTYVLKRNTRDSKGNLAITFAILSTVILGGIAVAVDGSRMLSLHSNLQDMADSAVLTAAIAASNDETNPISSAETIIGAMSSDLSSAVTLQTPEINLDTDKREVTVALTAEQDMFLASILGKSHREIVVNSAAVFGASGPEPTSFVFVLDISGSMHAPLGGKKRIEVLQETVNEFFADMQSTYNPLDLSTTIRTGLKSYNKEVLISQSTDMDGGWTHILNKVDNFSTGKGTLPHEAMEQAVAMLKADRTTPGTPEHREIIMYMTDGEVDEHLVTSGNSATQRTKDACDEAKTAGMEIFAIGIGLQPAGEPLLQYCATPGNHPDTGQPYYYSTRKEVDFKYAFNAASLGESDAEIRLK